MLNRFDFSVSSVITKNYFIQNQAVMRQFVIKQFSIITAVQKNEVHILYDHYC